MSANINIVRQLKEDLLKQQARPPGDGRNEKILDILQRLDKVSVDIAILTETLIGASVSKLKSHSDENVASTSRSLVKKWKTLAKSQGATSGPSSGNGSSGKSASKSSSTSANGSASLKRMPSSDSAGTDPETEFQGLPPLRLNMCKKLHSIFVLSQKDLSKEINASAVKQLCISRASEVEAAVDAHSKGGRQSYSDKARCLVFNLKKNGPLRDRVILGQVSADRLAKMSSEELQTEEKAKERTETVEKLQESRRLDWEQANEQKINEACGIKGELLKASLFTCGRCKSTKTTSTQKQTRSADEPMTVFVLCLNCGNRWKC